MPFRHGPHPSHDEQADFLALNLMHDIVMNERTVEVARRYYAEECLGARRGTRRPTWTVCGSARPTGSDDDLQRAQDEGKARTS